MGMGKGRCAGMSRAAKLKVRTTQVDGGSEIKALAQLNITKIGLGGDATMIQLPDGSLITGQTGFIRRYCEQIEERF